MAAQPVFSKNIFAALDSDAEDAPKAAPVAVKKTGPSSMSSPDRPRRTDNRTTTNSTDRPRRTNPNGVSGGDNFYRSNPRSNYNNANEDAPLEEGRRPARTTGGGRIERPRGRGREFDRHSGTGRGKEVKKGGAGGHNWGAPEVEAASGAAAVAAAWVDDAAEGAVPTTPKEGEGEVSGAANGAEKTPAEPQELNYLEYQRLQRAARELANKDIPIESAAPRTIDESELEKEGYARYQKAASDKGDEDDIDRHDDANGVASDAAKRSLFDMSYRGRGNRRGGNRRDNNGSNERRSNERKTTPPQPQPNLSDDTSFPSL